jgi:uncharacterized membrane protein YkoI
MKTVMISLLTAALLASCSNQHIPSAKVPSVVLNTAKERHPDAAEMEWKKIGQLYEAEVKIGDSIELDMRINEGGNLVLQKQEVTIKEVPPAVQAMVKERYPDYTIDEADMLQKDGAAYYQLELDSKGKKDIRVVVTADGKEETGIAFWE